MPVRLARIFTTVLQAASAIPLPRCNPCARKAGQGGLPRVQRAPRRSCSGRIEFGRRQDGEATAKAPDDQHLAVLEPDGCVAVTCRAHGAGLRPGTCTGIVEFGRRQVAAAAKAPGDQHLAVLEPGGRVARPGRAHGAGLRPGTCTGIVEFGRRQVAAALVKAPGDQHLAVLEPGGCVARPGCAHAAGGRPGATAGMGDWPRPDELHQPHQQEEGHDESDKESELSHGYASFLPLGANHRLVPLRQASGRPV